MLWRLAVRPGFHSESAFLYCSRCGMIIHNSATCSVYFKHCRRAAVNIARPYYKAAELLASEPGGFDEAGAHIARRAPTRRAVDIHMATAGRYTDIDIISPYIACAYHAIAYYMDAEIRDRHRRTEPKQRIARVGDLAELCGIEADTRNTTDWAFVGISLYGKVLGLVLEHDMGRHVGRTAEHGPAGRIRKAHIVHPDTVDHG